MLTKEEYFQNYIMCIGEPGIACGNCPYLEEGICKRPGGFDTRQYERMMREVR